MNSDKQAPNLIAYQPHPVYDDEINLVDIVIVLFRRKKLILGITIFVVFVGLFYAFSKQRVYQVESILSPPSHESILSFNLRNFQNIKEATIYSSFISLVKTRGFRKAFFDKFNLIEILSSTQEQELTARDANKIFEAFSDSIKISKNSENSSIEIILEGGQKGNIGPWLDDFIFFADETVVNQLVYAIQLGVDYNIKKLKLEIKNKKLLYKQSLQDELERLNENYKIAKELEIVERKNRNSTSFNNNSSIYLNKTKMYLEGSKILGVEIKALKNRKSTEMYITGLRALQAKLLKFEAIRIDKNKLQSIHIEKKAIVDVVPIRPNRKLIVILSLILGGMLGIFAAFILEFISNLKKQISSVDAV